MYLTKEQIAQLSFLVSCGMHIDPHILVIRQRSVTIRTCPPSHRVFSPKLELRIRDQHRRHAGWMWLPIRVVLDVIHCYHRPEYQSCAEPSVETTSLVCRIAVVW